MAKSNLTAEHLRSILEYHPDTGHLVWRADGWKHKALDRAGGLGHSAGYRSFQIDKTKYLEHRLIYFYVTGEWPNVIDHINGDRTDNRWCNLRNVSHTINMQNIKKAQSNSKTGVLGVYWVEEKKRFIARIHAHGKIWNVGRFTNLQEAGEAYISAKRKLHEGGTL